MAERLATGGGQASSGSEGGKRHLFVQGRERQLELVLLFCSKPCVEYNHIDCKVTHILCEEKGIVFKISIA